MKNVHPGFICGQALWSIEVRVSVETIACGILKQNKPDKNLSNLCFKLMTSVSSILARLQIDTEMARFAAGLFVLFLLRRCVAGEISVKCTQDFCDEYVQKFPCPPLDPACSNTSISLVIPSATVCNCCEHCFLFQEEGDDCVTGKPGQHIPKVMCKPGTECQNGKCRKKKEPDPDFYPGYECQDGRCNCTVLVNKVPKIIFGTFNKSERTEKEKQCQCSIDAYFARQSINHFLPVPDAFLPVARCLPNGQFDPLQCIGNKCGCVDRATGAWDGTVRKVPIELLGPQNPKCFDQKRHKVGEYYTKCEKETRNLMADLVSSDLEGVRMLLSHKVICTPDGEYGSVEV